MLSGSFSSLRVLEDFGLGLVLDVSLVFAGLALSLEHQDDGDRHENQYAYENQKIHINLSCNYR